MNSAPTLSAVEDMLMDALDDSPGAGSDLTPPVGAILAALHSTRPKRKVHRELPVRDITNPWVCSILFQGDEIPMFLKASAGPSSPTPLLLTTKAGEALTSHYRSTFTFCWPALIASHGMAIGKKPRAIVHRLKDPPEF